MIQVNDTVAISRSPNEVFAFIADLNNIPKFQAEVVTSKVITPGPTQVGTRFTEEVKVGFARALAHCEVTEFLPGTRMSFRANSPSISYEGRFVVEASDGGARLTINGSAQPKGWWKLIQPLLSEEFKTGVKKELSAIKQHVEKM